MINQELKTNILQHIEIQESRIECAKKLLPCLAKVEKWQAIDKKMATLFEKTLNDGVDQMSYEHDDYDYKTGKTTKKTKYYNRYSARLANGWSTSINIYDQKTAKNDYVISIYLSGSKDEMFDRISKSLKEYSEMQVDVFDEKAIVKHIAACEKDYKALKARIDGFKGCYLVNSYIRKNNRI